MSNSMTCLFCTAVYPITRDTVQSYSPCFRTDNARQIAMAHGKGVHEFEGTRDAIDISFCLCPNCNKHSINISGIGNDTKELSLNVVPGSLAKQYPDYIPQSIRNDYEEAYEILHLSPKASATLSRRCLQGMIRDFWKINNKKSLYLEIESLKDKVDPQVWKVLDSVRQIGNIGAHMEKDINLIVDIDPGESEKLIKLIEYLLEQWYIKRHETDELLNDIVKINDDKQKIRKT